MTDSIELSEQIARREADKKRIRYELKLLQKRRKRWSKIDLGFLQAIVMSCFKNVSRKTSMVFTITLNILFSLFDIGSDFYVAITLFASGEWEYGIVVMVIDYLPGWELLIHNFFSKRWSRMKNGKELKIMVAF